MASFYDRFYAAPATPSGSYWSRWLSASDLTLADANLVTIVSAPADVGDEITVTTRNQTGSQRVRASTCAIYTFDMAQLDPVFDSAKDQIIDMQLEFSAFADALLAIGPTNTAGTEGTMAVGQYFRSPYWHSIEMHGNTVANRGRGSSIVMTPCWGNFICQPDWDTGVVAQIISTNLGGDESGAGSNNNFGTNTTQFAVLLGFNSAADNGNQVTTFKARFAVRDLTP